MENTLMVEKIKESVLKEITEKQKAGKSISEILEESRDFTITNTYYNNFVNLNRNNENNPRTRAPYSSVGKRKKRLGYEPVNPLENGLSEHDTWEAHIAKDISDLLQCKAIYMLQDWQESKGARIEYYIATEIGMPIMYEIEKL